jgi:hypothetical protein
MAKLELKFTGDFEQILNQLHEDLTKNSYSMKLVEVSNYELGDIKVALRVYNKFYMRNGSLSSLNLTFIKYKNEIYVTAIAEGGSVFNTEQDMLDLLSDSFKRIGIEVTGEKS